MYQETLNQRPLGSRQYDTWEYKQLYFIAMKARYANNTFSFLLVSIYTDSFSYSLATLKFDVIF
jgi:hypothetical protein